MNDKDLDVGFGKSSFGCQKDDVRRVRCSRPSVELFLENSFLIRRQTNHSNVRSPAGILWRGRSQHLICKEEENRCKTCSTQGRRGDLPLRENESRQKKRESARRIANTCRSRIFPFMKNKRDGDIP